VVAREVTEAVLNHISGSCAGIAGVHQHHDWATEKRAALDAWAAHVLAVVEGRTTAAALLTPASLALIGCAQDALRKTR
jgi:hypothetical protein